MKKNREQWEDCDSLAIIDVQRDANRRRSMRKLLLTAVATATILLAGSAMWKAEAAMPSGAAGALPPLANAATPLESVGCWCGPYRCACRRWWWGPGVYRYHRWGWRPGVYRWRY
jgi:hypothetical protein